MCDEFTAADEDAALARKGLSRREFAALGAVGALAACTTTKGADGGALTETNVAIPTSDGTADALFVHPAKGRHPGIVMWPDIAGLRPAFMEMARRLAGSGYAVLLVNHYYRGMKAPITQAFSEYRTAEGQAKLKPLIATLSPEHAATDAQAFIGWLDKQGAVDTARGVGVQGYCQTGGYGVRSAAAVPARVRQACSFHGAGLVGDTATAPSKLLPATRAEYLFAIARNDDAKAPTDKDALRAAAAAAGKMAEIEVYNADHGWCVPDSPSYDRAEAERAWARLLDHYARL
ncbi:dienelactone hydrolase family protein [Parablastomonas sp. CN1-191]|uniref:dienelactone hydrolase family protein n=1 Tax=Parablastomonas sp. CN1-191 TaxID=3400908 RepID=UPI003BF7FC1C